MNIEKLRLRRLRTGQVREKAESCAVDLLGGGRKEKRRKIARARPEEEKIQVDSPVGGDREASYARTKPKAAELQPMRS